MLSGGYEVVPNIRLIGLTDNEAAVLHVVNTALNELHSYTVEFEAAIMLLNHAKAQAERDWHNPIFRNWSFLAAKSAAMTVWHFGEAMNGIKANARRSCLPLNAIVRWDTVRDATKMYGQYFPHSEGLRDAVAHHANLSETIEATNTNSLKSPNGGQVLLKSNLVDGALVYSQKGQERSLKIDEATLKNLISVRDRFYSALETDEDKAFRKAITSPPYRHILESYGLERSD
jgi:hypothetical protein